MTKKYTISSKKRKMQQYFKQRGKKEEEADKKVGLPAKKQAVRFAYSRNIRAQPMA